MFEGNVGSSTYAVLRTARRHLGSKISLGGPRFSGGGPVIGAGGPVVVKLARLESDSVTFGRFSSIARSI